MRGGLDEISVVHVYVFRVVAELRGTCCWVVCWGPTCTCGHGSVFRPPVSFVGSCSLHWFLCLAMCRTLEFATAAVADRFLAGRVTLGPPWS